MASSASESPTMPENDSPSLKQVTSPFFDFSGFLVGFGVKGLSEPDSERSPTSPLDFRVLPNFSNLFSPRASTRSSLLNIIGKKHDEKRVGLCIVPSLQDEAENEAKDTTMTRRESIVFGRRVRIKSPGWSGQSGVLLNPPCKPSSLPKDYIPSQLTAGDSSKLGDKGSILGSDGASLNSLCSGGVTSSSSTAEHHRLSAKSCSPEEKPGPAIVGRISKLNHLSSAKPSSLPVVMVSGNRNETSDTISAREMKLSEDYTCIISHGPKPRMTHIFGDCVLEDHAEELADFEQPEEQGMISYSTGADQCPIDSGSCLSSASATNCFSCNKTLRKDEEIYLNRQKKAFCSIQCSPVDNEMKGDIASVDTIWDDEVFGMEF